MTLRNLKLCLRLYFQEILNELMNYKSILRKGIKKSKIWKPKNQLFCD